MDEEIKNLMKRIIKGMEEEIKQAAEDNKRWKRMQDFIIEKLTVEIILEHKRPSQQWFNQGLDHYANLSGKIGRNDALVRLIEEGRKLMDLKDPIKIKEIVEKKEEHLREVATRLSEIKKSPPLIFP